eukprot:scaffold132_cov170-Amphora_coffeaeformis.AAC.55
MKLTHWIHKALLLFTLLVRHGASEVTRPYHLDYLDVETMEYYLTAPTEDFDVAVLFYAQWCNNCHKFAPLWDQISRIHQAGTEQSNLIMGLFDCEADAAHSEVCNKAGVKHYPTITFFSLSGQKFPLRKPRHSTQFGGNWQYGDAVYDWLRTVSGLSGWHRLGWGKKLRSLVFGTKTKPKDKALPKGVPGRSSASQTTAGAGGSSASSGSAALDKKLKDLETEVKEYKEIAVRSSTLLDAILFPLTTGEYVVETDNKKNVTDVFHLLADSNGWNSTDNQDLILKSCVMEISLDYCSRLNTWLTNDWVASQVGLETLTDEVVAAYTNYLNEALPASEPYCMIVEECILSDYAMEECRPARCPFQDPAACRYISACLAPELQAEYAAALNLSTDQSTLAMDTSEKADAASSSGSSKKKGGWGM